MMGALSLLQSKFGRVRIASRWNLPSLAYWTWMVTGVSGFVYWLWLDQGLLASKSRIVEHLTYVASMQMATPSYMTFYYFSRYCSISNIAVAALFCLLAWVYGDPLSRMCYTIVRGMKKKWRKLLLPPYDYEWGSYKVWKYAYTYNSCVYYSLI